MGQSIQKRLPHLNLWSEIGLITIGKVKTMRKSPIGNPCVECLVRVTCNKSEYDGSACEEYVHWKFDHDNYIKLKRYGHKILMTKRFMLGSMKIAEAIGSAENDFDVWLQSLSRADQYGQRAYVQYLVDNFYRWSRQKDANIENVIRKFQI